MTCEHELNIETENWIDENKVELTLKCDICNSKFTGVVVKH